MKFNAIIFLLTGAVSAFAQGSFQNLNFEQANPMPIVGSPYYPYDVTVASALPHWAVSLGGVQQTQMFYDSIATGSTAVTLIGNDPTFGDFPIDGNYSVLLQGGLTASTAAISQTGTIPAGTQSLYLEVQAPPPAVQTPLQLMVGTQLVPLAAVGTGPNYTLYGANIAAWAGDSETLTLQTLEGQGETIGKSTTFYFQQRQCLSQAPQL